MKNVSDDKWKQIRGKLKAWWDKLMEDDLDRVPTKFKVLQGVLQEKYGYTPEAANDDIAFKFKVLSGLLHETRPRSAGEIEQRQAEE